MKILTSFLLLFTGFLGSSQVLDKYPPGQHDYLGGNVQLYQDLHNIFMKSGFKPCEDTHELYRVKYLVEADATIRFVKDASEDQEKNQCARQLVRDSFKYLKRWSPAEINGIKVPAVSETYVYPADLFDDFKQGYDITEYSTPPSFGGGMNAFRQLFMKHFKIPSSGAGLVPGPYLLSFTINEKGKIADVEILQSYGNKEMDEQLIEAVRNVKGKWTPAKIHGIPVSAKFKMPISIRIR